MNRLVWIALQVVALTMGVTLGYAASAYKQGTLTTAGADCNVATRCVVASLRKTFNGSVQIANTFTGTMVFEATTDDLNWNFMSLTPLGGGSAATSVTATGVWIWSNTAVSQFRVRANALSSGTPAVSILGTD